MKSIINHLTITLILASCCIFSSSHAEESRGPEIVFSAGREGGGYWGVAQRMKAVSAESELSVLVKESAGSIQNLDRLADPGNAVNLTLAQADAIEYYLKDHPDLANHVQVIESIGLECVFLITDTKSGIHTIKDLFDGKGHRIAIPSPESGIAVTYQYMTRLMPELAATEPVFTDTEQAMESMKNGLPQADVVMVVHRHKIRSGAVSKALDDPAHFRFVSIEDNRLTKAPQRGKEGAYSFLDVPLVRGGLGSQSIPTVCTKGSLLAAKDKLTSGQLEKIKYIMDFQWMRIYPTDR